MEVYKIDRYREAFKDFTKTSHDLHEKLLTAISTNSVASLNCASLVRDLEIKHSHYVEYVKKIAKLKNLDK